jgi:hypothetical protein
MKKLLLSIVLVLLTFTLSAQKISNYEKYWQAREDSITKSQMTSSNNATENQITSVKPEYDDLYYQPNKDAQKIKKHKRVNTEDTLRAIVDTLVKENPNINVNYYEYDPFLYSYNIGRFYHGGFNYWMYSDPWFYNNYWMMDNWNWEYGFMGSSFWNPWYYNDFGFGFGFNNWWYSNWSPWRHNHNWSGNHNWYTHNHNWNNGGNGYNSNHGYAHIRQESSSNINRRVVQPQTKATYQANRRSYQPSYNNPRMNTRPQYNNSRIDNNILNRRSQVNTQSRTQANTERRTYIQSNNQRSTQSRNYSVPSRSSTYSQPSRSYNSGNVNRSSNYSSGSYNSGSANRSSGSGSNSGGSSSSRTSGTRR